MKKAAAILLAFSMLLLVGCGNTDGDVKRPTETSTPVTSGEGYEITMLRGEDGNEKYSYTVTTHDGTVLETAICANEPKVKPLSDDLLGVRFYTDTSSSKAAAYRRRTSARFGITASCLRIATLKKAASSSCAISSTIAATAMRRR